MRFVPSILMIALAARVAGAQSPATPATPAAPTRTVAITFDDLPVVSYRQASDAAQLVVTRRLLAAIAAHRVPAIGFVNERKLWRDGTVDDGQVAMLRLWVNAGLELGNHTWSHADLHAIPVDSFVREIVRGDSVTRVLLDRRGRRPRWFRHPMLHTGRSLAARATVDSALRSRGYAVAPVTLDNYDYQFAVAYERALTRGDRDGAAHIATLYLDYMEHVFAYYEAQSRAIVGREIAQVLLLHASTLNADTFDRLARMIERRGYAFASLDRVLADPAYRLRDDYIGPAGITWLHRWALTRGMPGTTFAGEPEAPAEIVAASR